MKFRGFFRVLYPSPRTWIELEIILNNIVNFILDLFASRGAQPRVFIFLLVLPDSII